MADPITIDSVTDLIETARRRHLTQGPPDVLYVTEAEWQVLLDRFPPPRPYSIGLWHRADQPLPPPPWLAREGRLFGVPVRIDDSRARRQRTLPVFMDLADVSVRESRMWGSSEAPVWWPEVGVMVEQRLPGPPDRRHVAGLMNVHAEAYDTLPATILVSVIEAGLDHVFRPWKFSDRPMPRLDLFPRLSRLLRRFT